jgi:hypothetical protein
MRMAAELAHTRGGIEAASVSLDALRQHSPSSITSPSARVSPFVLLVKSCVCGMAPAAPRPPTICGVLCARKCGRARTRRQEAPGAPRGSSTRIVLARGVSGHDSPTGLIAVPSVMPVGTSCNCRDVQAPCPHCSNHAWFSEQGKFDYVCRRLVDWSVTGSWKGIWNGSGKYSGKGSAQESVSWNSRN